MENFNDILFLKLFVINEQEITVFQIVTVPLLLILGFLLLRILTGSIAKRLETRKVNADAIHLFRRVFFVIGAILLFMTALGMLGIPLTAFAFVSGAIALGVGFGAQNIINNFISGWILMWERPIKIGDFLELGDITRGTVEAINTRSTRIRRVDGVHLLVPNSYLLENTVVNWTLVDRLARNLVRVGVAYGSPVKKVAELINQAVEEHGHVLADPAPSVIFEDFGDNSLIFDAYFWANSSGDKGLREIRSDIRFRIDELFNDNGIVIAFPQRDVHIDGELIVKQP